MKWMAPFLELNVDDTPPNASTAELHFELIWERYVHYCKGRNLVPNQTHLQNAMELRYGTLMRDDGFEGWRKIALWSNSEKQKKRIAAIDTNHDISVNLASRFIELHVNEKPPNASTAELHLEVIWNQYYEYYKQHHQIQTYRYIYPCMDTLQDAMELRYGFMHEKDEFRGWRNIALLFDS